MLDDLCVRVCAFPGAGLPSGRPGLCDCALRGPGLGRSTYAVIPPVRHSSGSDIRTHNPCVLGVRALPPSAARPPPGVSAASGAPPARRRVLARVGPGGTAAAGVPAL